MKVYNKVVIDMASMTVIEEDAYLYDGDIAECKGGGGGSSGKVDYPTYMKTAHEDWLHHTADTMTYSVVDLMNTAMSGNSPYYGFTPTDPNTVFFAATKTAVDYRTPYEMLKCFDQWSIDTAFTSYMATDASYITAAVAAFTASMDDEINNNVLPAYKAGMDDLNAVATDFYTAGTALIWDTKAKKVAEFEANVRLQRIQAGSDISLKRIAALIQWRQTVTQFSGEFSRIYLAAKHEQNESTLDAAHKDKTWDLEMYQYGTQVMASIAGSATAKGTSSKSSALGGAISGAMTGAAMGGMIAGASAGAIGGPMGMAVGAGLGLAMAMM